jgi:hypothetical protein
VGRQTDGKAWLSHNPLKVETLRKMMSDYFLPKYYTQVYLQTCLKKLTEYLNIWWYLPAKYPSELHMHKYNAVSLQISIKKEL